MDRVGLADIEREIDAEARERFPGGAVRQVVLLQYGDDPRSSGRPVGPGAAQKDQAKASGRGRRQGQN